MADYVKMWEDLGMDINNHDNLCQVLPTAVGDVFMTQENRPKAMDFWDMVIAEVHGIRPAELIEEQKKGRKVFGTFCVYVPAEKYVPACKSFCWRKTWTYLPILPYCRHVCRGNYMRWQKESL